MVKMLMKSLMSKVLNTPFVIEEGTSGIWNYRKWSDGTAECWGKDAGNSYSINSWGSWYYIRKDNTESYPTGLFIERPVAQAWFTSGSDFISSARGTGTVNETPTVLGIRPTTLSNPAAYANYYSVGRWK